MVRSRRRRYEDLTPVARRLGAVSPGSVDRWPPPSRASRLGQRGPDMGDLREAAGRRMCVLPRRQGEPTMIGTMKGQGARHVIRRMTRLIQDGNRSIRLPRLCARAWI